MIYGVVEGDTIVNVIEAESLEDAQAAVGADVELVEDVQRGWVRTGDTWAAPVVEPVKRDLSALDFEMHVQSVAALDDDAVLAMLDDPALRLFWRRLGQADMVAADHPLIVQGLDTMVSLGHLTEAQRQTVLDDWPVS